MKTREPVAQRACDVSPVECNAAGPSAGLLAGAQGSLVRSLRCPEMVVLSWGVWYVLAIVITTAVGPAVAPHCLRW
ncbi:NrsF family protein [Paraburkholderia sp. BR10954]|uniref:NrsF family protein n=1 Tax=Paraburkholderia sp. BR10954 TaxID=3236995 RepID=UPI0034D3203B